MIPTLATHPEAEIMINQYCHPKNYSTIILQMCKRSKGTALHGETDVHFDKKDLLFRNFTLQQVLLPLADITQSYRSSPDRTKEALFKVSLNKSLSVEQLLFL